MPDDVSKGSRRSGAPSRALARRVSRQRRGAGSGASPLAGRRVGHAGPSSVTRAPPGGRRARRSGRRRPRPLDRPVARRPELVLHLHRLDHEEPLAGLDGVALRDGDRHDPSRDDGTDLGRPVPGRRPRGLRVARSRRRPVRSARVRPRTASRRPRPRGRPAADRRARRRGRAVARPARRTVASLAPAGRRRAGPRRRRGSPGPQHAARRRGSHDDRSPVARTVDPGRVIAATGRLPSARRPVASRRRRRGRAGPAARRRPASESPGGERSPRRRRAGDTRRPLGRARPSAPRPSRSTGRPPGTPSCRATNRWNGSVVWMPAISVSSRARREPVDRRVAVAGVDHDLGDQVVVVGRHAVARLDGRVDPDARARRHDPAADPARRRREVARRILGGDADLDRVARRGRPPARPAASAASDSGRPAARSELLADDVEAATRARSRRARPGAGC